MVQETTAANVAIVRNLLNSCLLLQSHLRLYGTNNANIALTSARMMGFLDQLLAWEETLTIYIARHGFLFGDGFIDRANRKLEAFANRLFQHGIASLTLSKGIPPREIHDFLLLVARKPSETWDEGGISACLQARKIKHLIVREMSEQDFLLDEESPVLDPDNLRQQRSPLWEKFALSVLQGLHCEVPEGADTQELSPPLLAEETNRQMQGHPDAELMTFTRDASRFLLSLKHENIRIYRAAAINKLAEYVNALSPNLRRLFLNNAFNLNLDADLSEGFLSGLSDQVILEALENATLAKSYTPPVVLKLLGRLAKERGIADETVQPTVEVEGEVVAGKLKELFKSDDFDKHVPKQYQNALLAIIHGERLPIETTEQLEALKATLEPGAVEHHLGDLLFEILRETPDPKHAEGIRNNVIGTLDFYLTRQNYRKLLELFELCQTEGTYNTGFAEIREHLSSPRVTTAVLDALSQQASDQAEDAWALIYSLRTPFVGPLLERLSTETNRSTRSSYLKALQQLGGDCVAEAVTRLEDSRWFVTRNMLYLLREFGDRAALPHIRKHLDHPHLKVSQEALRTCLFFRDAEAIPFLLRALETKNEVELISAINLASLANDPRVVARLAELLRSGTLLDYNLEVRRAAVRSLATVAPRQSLHLFADVLNSFSLLKARQHDALKIEIIFSLEKYPPHDVAHLLEEQVRSGSNDVARAAQFALRNLTGDKP